MKSKLPQSILHIINLPLGFAKCLPNMMTIVMWTYLQHVIKLHTLFKMVVINSHIVLVRKLRFREVTPMHTLTNGRRKILPQV